LTRAFKMRKIKKIALSAQTVITPWERCMKHNYSYAGIAVALKDWGCRLTASTRGADRLQIVEVTISLTLGDSKGLWVRGLGQNPHFEGALGEADASILCHLAEWYENPKNRVRFLRQPKNGSHLDRWLKLGGKISIWHQNGLYVFELGSIGSMKPGWRVLRLETRSLNFECANEIAGLELGGLKLEDSSIKILVG